MKTIGHLLGSLLTTFGRLLGQLLRLPFRVVGKVAVLTFAVGKLVGSIPLRLTRRTTRILGVRGVLFGVLGLAIGLLLAPVPGKELRRKLAALAADRGTPTDADLIEKVTFELSHAPRTWHLEPQPDVAVVAGRVILTGEARDDSAADEFGRVAAAIPGVVEVDNRLIIGGGIVAGSEA
jgi:hypothetical protein